MILEPRANARFLSLMMGLFNARTAEGPVGNYFSGKQPGTTKVGEKLFGDMVTIKSDIGNSILRQTPIGTDGMAAKPVTWVEKGVLKNLFYDRAWAKRQNKDASPTNTGMSLVMEGTDTTMEQMIKSTKRGLIVTFFWYIRPVDNTTLLNTGMTRDGLFLIENGEVAGPGAELPLEHVAARRLQQRDRRRSGVCRFTPARRTTARARRSCRRSGSKIST